MLIVWGWQFLTLLRDGWDVTGVEALVEVSVSDPLAGDVPALGWRCEAYDHHQRYHRQIGKTIRTTRNPLHMVRCPLILSQPFHFELLCRTWQLFSSGDVFSKCGDWWHRQLTSVSGCDPRAKCWRVSALLGGFSTTVGISWATRSSLGISRPSAHVR